MLRWILCAALVTAAAASAVPAGAQPSSPDLAEAASLYRSAEQAMADKRYDDAARDYGAAYEISKDAILFFKIASALDKGGKCPVAITYYRRYLREGKPSADHQKLTNERIATCEGKASSAPPPTAAPANPSPGDKPATDKAPSPSDKAPAAGDKAPPPSDKAPAAGDKAPASPAPPSPAPPADKDKAKSPTPPSTSGEAKAPVAPAKPADKGGDKPADTKTGTKAGDKTKPTDPKTKAGSAGAMSEAGPSPTSPAPGPAAGPTDLAAAPPRSGDPAAPGDNSDPAAPEPAAATEPARDRAPIDEPTPELANAPADSADVNADVNPDNAFTAPASDAPAPTYPPPSLRRTGAWLAVGAGIAFATVGTVLALSAESTEDDIADLYLTRAGEDPQEFDRATQDRYDTLVERGDRYQLLSWVSFGAAAATAGVATYLFLTSSSSSTEREPQALALRPLLSHQGAGVNASWAF